MSSPEILPVITISQSKLVWPDTVPEVLSDDINTLYIKIVPNGVRKIMLCFPVEGQQQGGQGQALATASTWGSKKLFEIIADDKNWTPDKNTEDFNYVFNFPEEDDQATEYFYTLTFKTIEINPETALTKCPWQFDPDTNGYDDRIQPGPCINITKRLKDPLINEFKTDRGIVEQLKKFTLEWSVDAAKVILSATNKSDREFKPKDSLREDISADTIYTLTAINGTTTQKKTTAEVEIKYHNQRTLGVLVKPFKENPLVNLCAGDKMMYALARTPGKTPDVFTWQSKDGINWEKSSAYSFKASGLPIDIAGCSGIVYKSQILLIGGSRYDTDYRSNEVYSIDLEADGNVKPGKWKKRDFDKAPFSKRMGQAVVICDKKVGTTTVSELWLLGGFDGANVLNDVHTFNGTVWEAKPAMALPNGLCKHQAIWADDKLQLFGGFGDVPGQADQTLRQAVVNNLNSGGWSKLTWYGGSGSLVDMPLVSCGVAMFDNTKFVFSVFLSGSDIKSSGDIMEANKPLASLDLAQSPLKNGFLAAVQVVTFNNAAWFCSIDDSDKFASNQLTYFVNKVL